MAKHDNDAVWVNINPETLSEAQLTAWTAYKLLYRQMKDQRLAFETLMAQGVADGQRMIFGYNFGKLSVAVVADDRKASKPKAQQMSLAQYLETMSASGRAV